MAEKHSKTSWFRRLALPVSIFLNLFLIGLIGGHLLYNHSNREISGTLLDRTLAKAEKNLPPQEARAFGDVLRRDAPHYQAALQQLTKARQELKRQITAEQFDKEGVRQALAAWLTTWNSLAHDFSNTLVEALAQVSPEGRNKLVAERWRIGRPGSSFP